VALLLLLVLVVGTVTMFVVVSSCRGRSRAVETWIDENLFKGERESGKAPGRLFPRLHESIDDSRKALARSAKAGPLGS
jgi:hypothetical protein